MLLFVPAATAGVLMIGLMLEEDELIISLVDGAVGMAVEIVSDETRSSVEDDDCISVDVTAEEEVVSDTGVVSDK